MKVNTVVVGFDGSSHARRALDAAADLVADDGVVHVVTAYDSPSDGEIARVMRALPDEFKHTVDLLAGPRDDLRDAEARLESRGVDYKGHFVEAKPAEAILDLAADVDAEMIVVGSRGLGPGSRFLRGSVSARVANHAPTSFMVLQAD